MRLKRAYSPGEVLNMKIPRYEFTGPWLASIGRPAKSGVWIVWGASGNGKSSFVMQLAKYLCRFGRVIYDSLEESTGLSLQMSLRRHRMEEVKKRLVILDREPMDRLEERLARRGSPGVAIIDSFQYSGLSYPDYKAFKERNARKLLIFISHAEGMHPAGRTARKVEYDADVKIMVSCFKAWCKSRFMEHPGEPYVIWEEGAAKALTEPLNRIDFIHPDERDVDEELKPLVRRLAEQNRQILSQMEDLGREHDRQDRLRREFTANVSHELKTPLTSINGFAELIRDGMVRPEDVQRFAGKICDEARRLMDLVGDILRLSRLEERGRDLAMEPLSLREEARQVKEQLTGLALRRGVTVTLAGSEGQIVASKKIVAEILHNLTDNAIQYNRPGGSVTITVSESRDTATVVVQDTGIGIPKEELPRIFERFYRVDKSHSRELGGTGLGLSIVKHGAVCLGAQLRVESDLGVGTTITVQFPKAGKEQSP